MNVLQIDLLEILKDLSLENNIEKFGEKSEQDYICYLKYFQRELLFRRNEFIIAKTIIKNLETILKNEESASEIVALINKIFSLMDPRDQNYRWGDCHCLSCQGKLIILLINKHLTNH